VDGIFYPLTRAGIQDAIDAIVAAGSGGTALSGTVSIAGPVMSDGIALTIPSYVTVDFNGYSFFAVADATSYDLITSIGSTPSSSSPLLLDGKEGGSLISLSVANANLFLAGDFVYLSGGTSQGVLPGSSSTVRAGQQANVIISVNTVTGNITLRDPLAWDFTVSQGATIARVATPVWSPGVKNVVLNGNGNTGSLTRLLVLEGVRAARIENVLVAGSLGNSMAAGVSLPTEYQFKVAGIYVSGAVDCSFEHVGSFLFNSSTGVRDIGLALISTSTVTALRSSGTAGNGPVFIFATYIAATSIMSAGSHGTALQLETSAYLTLTNVRVFTAANTSLTDGDGLVFSKGSHNNIVRNLHAIGNAGNGVVFQGDGDNRNQLIGFTSMSNTGLSVAVGTLNAHPVANYFAGNFDKAPKLFGDAQLSANTYVNVASGNGFYSMNLNGDSSNLALASDFPSWRSLIMQMGTVGGVDTQLLFRVRGSDGSVRQGAFTLT
jgi:hypothetical protein